MEKFFFWPLTVSCAEFCHDDRLRCRGLPGSWVMTTVFTAMKSLAIVMTTVLMAINLQINEKSAFYLQKEEYLNSFIAKSTNC
ncbi:MAG: hypothetical protein EGQ00_00655 [Parabacteroides johnsonii]|jgi:hypothetical protein|nr:hypothetical protein [Parabacteroides johnsonii]